MLTRAPHRNPSPSPYPYPYPNPYPYPYPYPFPYPGTVAASHSGVAQGQLDGTLPHDAALAVGTRVPPRHERST